MQEQGEEVIHVLTVRGKRYSIPERNALTLQDLKNELLRLTAIDPQRQQLIINGTLCKDPLTPLCVYGSNPVCILAQKADSSDKARQTASNSPGHAHVCNNCASQGRFERFLSREEEAAYRQEVEKLCPDQLVRQLRGVVGEVDEDLAVRALRACCNDLWEAMDFIELEMRGENFQETDIENRPSREPLQEQSFLRAYVDQQSLTAKISRSRDSYALFVASMKEKSPPLYDMLIRNRIFMEKLLFDRTPMPHQHSHGPAVNNHTARRGVLKGLRVSLSREEKATYVGRLTSFGLPREDAVWRLRQTGNNLLLAEERMMEGQSEFDSRQLLELLPQSCREHIVNIFFQSPSWEPFKAKLQKMDIKKAHALVISRLRKHFPAILSLSDNLWVIYPHLLGVPYSSIEMVRIAGIWPSLRLRKRSMADVGKQHRYYSGLVDRDIVQTLRTLGTQPSLAERATRAGLNLANWACMLVMLGKIPETAEAWYECEQNEVKTIDYFMNKCFYYSLYDVREFELRVAALAETNPVVYKAFLKYEGIYEAYRHLADGYHRPRSLAQQRQSMKVLLRQMGDMRVFHEYGIKAQMIAYSSFK